MDIKDLFNCEFIIGQKEDVEAEVTKMDIREMKPGRELDCEVIEKVMGWRIINREYAVFDDGTGIPKDFHPSTEISAAWEVVEKMKIEHWFQITESKIGAACELGKYGNRISLVICEAETTPLAISHAALLAMEDKA